MPKKSRKETTGERVGDAYTAGFDALVDEGKNPISAARQSWSNTGAFNALHDTPTATPTATVTPKNMNYYKEDDGK